MHCLTCEYDLSRLSDGVHRCPECGRVFDAADARTYAAGSARRGPLASVCIIVALASPVWVPLLVVWLRQML